MEQNLKSEVNEIMVKVLLENIPITNLFDLYSEEAIDTAVDMMCECYEFLVDKYNFIS
jgi:hypothetical protein